MSDTQTKLLAEYIDRTQQRMEEIAELFCKVSEQLQAQSQLMQKMEWQIVDLNKRLKSLESATLSDSSNTPGVDSQPHQSEG